MIRIEKDKILYIDYSNELHEIYPLELPSHLGDSVELGDFVTFSRIFDLIIDNKELFNTIFAKDLGFYKIEQYLEEYDKSVSHIHDSYDLEVHIVCQAHNYPDYKDLEYYTSFHGVGILEGDTESAEPYAISVSFTSLNELKNRYIHINNKVQIHTYSDSEEGIIKSSPFYDGEIKLFEFFAAILHEISFYGDPGSRDDIAEEIADSAEAIESGEGESMPWEDVKKEWEEELKQAEQEEERVRLENVKERISSGYIKGFMESTFRETVEKLEILEKDLARLERYEDAKLVREKIEKLKS